MANVLFNSHVWSLLKAVCQHIIDLCIILPHIESKDFATMTNVTVLPPLGSSTIAEADNSAATINQLDFLDCYW